MFARRGVGSQGVLRRRVGFERQTENICCQLQSAVWRPQHGTGAAQVQVQTTYAHMFSSFSTFKKKAKLKYSSDNMLFKLFLKNIQDELLLIRCY